MGQVVSDTVLTVLVSDVERGVDLGELARPAEGTELVVVTFWVKNVSSNHIARIAQPGMIIDADGNTYERTFRNTGRKYQIHDLYPGEVSWGDLVYEVPVEASGLLLKTEFTREQFGYDYVIIDLESREFDNSRLVQELQDPPLPLGEMVTANGWEATFERVRTATLIGESTVPVPDHEFIIPSIAVVNTYSQERFTGPTLFEMYLKDDTGRAFSLDVARFSLRQPFHAGNILPDVPVRGDIAYQVPTGRAPLYLTCDLTPFYLGSRFIWKVR